VANLHPLLERQLARIGYTDFAALPTYETWQQFLERLSQAYAKADQDRYLLERSFSISSEEMHDEIVERNKAEEALHKARESLMSQNQRLERVNELFRLIMEQLTESIKHGATGQELLNDLALLQLEFERLK
jgi:hypothetical protein